MGKREQYRKGFWWGRKEHAAERLTTKLLVAGLAFLGLYFWLKWLPLAYLAGVLLFFALLLRLVAAFAHGREKHYMDRLRFGKRK